MTGLYDAPSDPEEPQRYHSISSESEKTEKGTSKCHRTSVNEDLFSWKGI